MNRLVGHARAPALTLLVAAGFFMPLGVQPPPAPVDAEAEAERVAPAASPDQAVRPTARMGRDAFRTTSAPPFRSA